MPGRQIPVACIQLQAHDRAAFAEAWPRMLSMVEAACRAGAKLVVLPEGTIPGYVLGTAPIDEREIAAATADIHRVARAHAVTIVYGGAKIVAGHTFNAAIVVGPSGEELGHAAKQFLWHFDRLWYAAGNSLAPIATPLGSLGVLVCADGRIPTIAATLVDRGAELLVMPTAWVTSGRDPAILENIQADLMANVRARENAVPFVVANKCGVELESVAYCGKSAIIDASGNFVERASERDAAIVSGTITTGNGPALRATPAAAAADAGSRKTARIAFAFADAREAHQLCEVASWAEADLLLTCDTATERDGAAGGLMRIAVDVPNDAVARIVHGAMPGLRYVRVSMQMLADPRSLVQARLAGIDLFIADVDGDPLWSQRFARTRAAELRAYVVAFDAARRRAFAVDPDGVVVAGTFDGYRVATFVYDTARTSTTLVAPHTDVLAGLQRAESLRADRAALGV